MITPENIKLKDWVTIGLRASLVCRIYEDIPNRIEVVYLDDRNRAIAEDVMFENNEWTFVNSGPNGVYADNVSRFGEYVKILRAGRWINYK